MKKILFLALFLYNIILLLTLTYDYDDLINKKRHTIEDRKLMRQRILEKYPDGRLEHIDEHLRGVGLGRTRWDDKKRFPVYDEPKDRYDDRDQGSYTDMDRIKEYEHPNMFKVSGSHYDIYDKPIPGKGSQALEYAVEKEPLTKSPMNCERPHEKYEACFAGCASVTCDNPRERLRPCYPFCEPGCVCVHPYVRDDRTHKCVMPEDCTKGLKGIPDLNDEK